MCVPSDSILFIFSSSLVYLHVLNQCGKSLSLHTVLEEALLYFTSALSVQDMHTDTVNYMNEDKLWDLIYFVLQFLTIFYSTLYIQREIYDQQVDYLQGITHYPHHVSLCRFS